MIQETTSIIENGLTNVEFFSQQAIDKLEVNSKESMTKDQEINNFLTTMEEIVSGNDLNDFSNQVLLNWVTNKEDEKEIVSMKDESSPSNQGQPIEILENVEQVILLVYDKPIDSKAMVIVKSLLVGLERILKTDLFNISKDFLVVFG
jgi:hypothetical protein